MKNNNIIAKIQKLLSLANSSNENEAKAAMNMANTLLLKHNLSIQQISGYQVEYEIKNLGGEFLTLKLHQKLVSGLLKGYFFVEVLILKKLHNIAGRAQYKKTIQLVGSKENCEIASYIFSYLDHSYPDLWKSYKKNNPELTTSYHKESYYQGLTQGIKKMLESTKWKVQEEMGLILMADANLAKFVKQNSKGKYGNNSACASIDQKIYDDGVSDGSNITLRKPIKSDCEDGELKFLVE